MIKLQITTKMKDLQSAKVRMRRFEVSEKESEPFLQTLLKESAPCFLVQIPKLYLKDGLSLYGIFDGSKEIELKVFKAIKQGIYPSKHPLDIAILPDLDVFGEAMLVMFAEIHRRYVMTEEGLQDVYGIWELRGFGHCDNPSCNDFGLIPKGSLDEKELSVVCGKCGKVVQLKEYKYSFFPAMYDDFFFFKYSHLIPLSAKTQNYQHKIYGFVVAPREMEDIVVARRYAVKLTPRTICKKKD
ncbi:hypothetical protein EIN_083070 [Entamoeba invadens IP1]|uniref:hypothetical protein n=1 Tax=Entamoeba invadens IP1 TaxID=370355 RepID=UPI0002C3CF7E|nr:hypothetical protein EIN_083070 [Entamoeba invadens IP1]ELP85195.1 hypothetical protein EIN_083070 [Entamoeba invadens IP1]|eukprot:XP_004184541.1 hypothetical protein EIN_083070 [Entamoeba invadens IP1]